MPLSLRLPIITFLIAFAAPTSGQRMIADLTPGAPVPRFPTRFLGEAGATEILGIGNQVWSTDGTAAGTRALFELPESVNAVEGASVGSRLVLPVSGAGSAALWSTDGRTASLLARIGGPGSLGSVGPLTSLSTRAVFSAQDALANGAELWVTDGTTAGTRLLVDIWPGPAGSWPSQFLRSGALAFFFADDGIHGRELWRTDGTAAGTFLVAELLPGSQGVGGLAQMVPVAGGLVFPFQNNLWFSDGSSGGLVRGVALPPNAGWMVPRSNRRVFQVGHDLWSTDGSTSGTTRLRSFQVPILVRDGDIPVELGGDLLFMADDGVSGLELWATDGTVGGTRLLVDLVAGPAGSLAEPLYAAGGRAYLLAAAGPEGRELWVTDGTPAGTRLLADMTPGSASSRVPAIANLGATRLLLVSDGTQANLQVWRVDAAGAQRVAITSTVAPRTLIEQMVPTDDGAAIRFQSSAAMEVLRVDEDGQLTRLGGGSTLAARGAEVGYVRYLDFVVHDAVRGARVVHTFAGGLLPSRVDVAAGLYYLSVFFPPQLWRSDGTPAGTTFLAFAETFEFATFGSLAAASQTGGLLITDGTVAGTMSIPLPTATEPQELVGLGNKLLFLVQGDLWESDGTPGGTRVVAPVGFAMVQAKGAAGTRRAFFLSANDLIVSDGTPAGTRSVRRFADANFASLVVVDDRAFFAADELSGGDELWVSDGTPAGTVMIDVVPGPEGSYPRELAAIGDRVAFAASRSVEGRELWVSDGTAAGTTRVVDLWPGFVGSSPTNLVRAGRSVFFMADDGTGGEPWLAPMRLFGAAAIDVLAGACPGSNGVPRLRSGYARLGDANFALTLTGARATSPGVLMVGTRSDYRLLGPCALRVTPMVNLPVQVDAAGAARLGVPVPATPSLLGQAFLWQVAVADASGSLLGVASLSDGVRTVFGR